MKEGKQKAEISLQVMPRCFAQFEKRITELEVGRPQFVVDGAVAVMD